MRTGTSGCYSKEEVPASVVTAETDASAVVGAAEAAEESEPTASTEGEPTTVAVAEARAASAATRAAKANYINRISINPSFQKLNPIIRNVTYSTVGLALLLALEFVALPAYVSDNDVSLNIRVEETEIVKGGRTFYRRELVENRRSVNGETSKFQRLDLRESVDRSDRSLSQRIRSRSRRSRSRVLRRVRSHRERRN
jgi:hypothetical protein